MKKQIRVTISDPDVLMELSAKLKISDHTRLVNYILIDYNVRHSGNNESHTVQGIQRLDNLF